VWMLSRWALLETRRFAWSADLLVVYAVTPR
jgi:hypothetical protein